MGAELSQPDFEEFMGWFADPRVVALDTDLSDMLASQFGDLGWPSNHSSATRYTEAMSARFLTEQDGSSLASEFESYVGEAKRELEDGGDGDGGQEAGASSDAIVAAAGRLVGWLAGVMRDRQWDRYSLPDYDQNADARYRFDSAGGVYEWEDPHAPGSWLSEAEFGALAVGGEADGADRYSAPEYDENFHMWYRYDHGNKAYEWAEGDRSIPPGADAAWMTQSQADQARRYSAPEMDATSGARYRFDSVAGVYEWEDPRAAGSWLSEAEFSALRVGGAVDDADRYSAPRYDDNYSMWYRYDQADKSYEWAEGGRSTSPGATAAWMTQAQADQRLRIEASPQESGVPAEQSAAQVRAAATVRTEIMTPAVSDVVAKLRQELPPELVARIGPELSAWRRASWRRRSHAYWQPRSQPKLRGSSDDETQIARRQARR